MHMHWDKGEEINEATVRVMYSNAMVYMICSLNNYYFRVEQRMAKSGESSNLTQGISDRSIADYICYSVHENKWLVTVVLEK